MCCEGLRTRGVCICIGTLTFGLVGKWKRAESVTCKMPKYWCAAEAGQEYLRPCKCTWGPVIMIQAEILDGGSEVYLTNDSNHNFCTVCNFCAMTLILPTSANHCRVQPHIVRPVPARSRAWNHLIHSLRLAGPRRYAYFQFILKYQEWKTQVSFVSCNNRRSERRCSPGVSKFEFGKVSIRVVRPV